MPNSLYTQSEFKFAQYYLNNGPIEPGAGGLRPIAIDPYQVYADQISILNLWDFMKFKCQGDKPAVVIFSHGMVTQSAKTTGLSLVIDNKKNKELTKSTVELLLNENDLPAEQRRSKLGLNETDMKMIDNFLIDIQVCSISHLAFRACNIGNDPDYMLKIAKLFNAKFVSAPMQRDFFTKADFYRISLDDMDKLTATGARLKTYEDKAAEIAAAKGKKKARIMESGLTVHGAREHRVAIYIQKKTHTQFNLLAFATSAQAVTNFYRDRFDFVRPVRFTESDFFGDISLSQQPAGMKGRTMGLFGLSRGPNDTIKFPKDSAYTQLIKVIKNESYIGDLPMYMPPIDEDDLKPLNLRQRLARRVERAMARL